MRSVQPEWCVELPLQQQSVLFLAARGPDGIAKFHPCKQVVRAYRGTVLLAAKYGRPLTEHDEGDTFMSLRRFGHDLLWKQDVAEYLNGIDELPHHYIMHFTHGVQILGVHHPVEWMRQRWRNFYLLMVEDLHLRPEAGVDMDQRLDDWGQNFWDA